MKIHSQRGSAIIMLFIAVALFGMISYAFLQGSRSNLTMLTDEQAKANAAMSTECSNATNMGMKRLTARGCTGMISTAADGINTSPGAPSDGSCSLHHPNGGGVKPCVVAGPSGTCNGSQSIGTVCDDGTIYAGESPDGNADMFIAAADAPMTLSTNDGSSNWANTTANCTSNESTCRTGEANTALLVSLGTGPSPAPYEAAQYCHCLGKPVSGYCATDPTMGANGHGHNDWYQPALLELLVIYDNLVDQDGNNTPGGPLGSTFGFNTSGTWPAGYYLLSGQEGSSEQLRVRFNDGSWSGGYKDEAHSVRCVRKD